MFVKTLLHNHELPSHCWASRDALLGGEGGSTLVYPLCSTLLRELFLSFSFFFLCRLILPQQFFILHETPLQKQSTSLCHRLVVEFVW